MYPFECSEEKRSNEIPNKINLNQKINRKRERAEMHQRDKMRQHPKKRAPVAAGNKIKGSKFSERIFYLSTNDILSVVGMSSAIMPTTINNEIIQVILIHQMSE